MKSQVNEVKNKKAAKKAYRKPQLVYRDKVEILAAVCDSNWLPGRTCMIVGQATCQRTRF